MKKIFTTGLPVLFYLAVNAQAPFPKTMPFGKIDKADLEMTSCDFEKDANAEVLFEKGSVTFDPSFTLFYERHMRIKIFNDNGKDQANIKIQYYGGDRSESISGLQAETINLNNGSVEITKVDKKQIYTKQLDKARTEIDFAFPNVKPGSVIEFKYTLSAESVYDFPDWYFQGDIPTRYSELNTDIPNILHYKNLIMVNMPFAVNTPSVKALANVPSVREEPFMSSKKDVSQRILYELSGVDGVYQNFSATWKELGQKEVAFDDFGGQFKRKLSGEDVIIAKAKSLHTQDEKIAYVFNQVKNTMKWNERDERYTNDGTSLAWDKKIGNSTEINLIVNHLLQKVGVTSYPMLVSTRENGKVNPGYPSRYQFNKTVAFVPVDSANYFVLDATGKYNLYNEVPEDLLNGFGFFIDKENEKYDLFFLKNDRPARQVVAINAEIKPDGKMHGTAQINGFSYNRVNTLEKYKADGEKKYIDYLRDGDNNLKIASLKIDNMEVDSLPLTQNIDFTMDMAAADENYIYVKPNLFTGLGKNPFLNIPFTVIA